MIPTNFELKTNIGKSGQRWYQLRFLIGKYKSEPIFVSELEFDYLKDIKASQEAQESKINILGE